MIALDLMQNYKIYFPEDNPCNINNKFNYVQETHKTNRGTWKTYAPFTES